MISSRTSSSDSFVIYPQIISHGGGIPGFSTLVALLRDDNLGIVVLINGDRKNSVCDIIAGRVAEDVLGVSGIAGAAFDPTPRAVPIEAEPSNDSPSDTSLEILAGSYHDPAYGSVTFCHGSSSSSYCAQVLSDFAAVDPEDAASGTPKLFAAWPTVLSSHARLVHRSANAFYLEITSLFPQGYGADQSPFEQSRTGLGGILAEFAFDPETGKVSGFGVFGIIGDKTERWQNGGTIEERADVWFKRI